MLDFNASSPRPPLSALIMTAICLMTLSKFTYATELDFTRHPIVNTALCVIILLQTLLLLRQSKTRRVEKKQKESLKHVQKDLEQRVAERTEKMRVVNNQLYEEIAKHEITEVLLRETQDYLNSIINSMPSVLIGVTREGTITHWNTAATRITDTPPEDALNHHLFDVYRDIPIPDSMIREVIDAGIPQTKENIQHGSGSHAFHSDVTVYPLVSSELNGAVIRIDDVTMRVRIENMMIQNEKMMSLGELAAGMAHEINNPLSAILYGVQNIYRRTSSELPQNQKVAEALDLNLEDIQKYLSERDIYKFIDHIREAGERSARIVTNMLEFSRSNSRTHTLTNLADLVNHSLELAHNSFELKTPDGSELLHIIKEFDQSLPNIRCSAAEIQQVILNLLRNACQAFNNEEYGPPLNPTISLRIFVDQHHVRLVVSDNGPGMPEHIRRHIFEPFFTTKEVGKGTGLGLSVTYFIITEHHDGTIEVKSEPGQGTQFIITLPIAEPQHEHKA